MGWWVAASLYAWAAVTVFVLSSIVTSKPDDDEQAWRAALVVSAFVGLAWPLIVPAGSLGAAMKAGRGT